MMKNKKEIVFSPYEGRPITLTTIKKWIQELEEKKAKFGDWITSGDTIVINNDKDYLVCKIEMAARIDDGK